MGTAAPKAVKAPKATKAPTLVVIDGQRTGRMTRAKVSKPSVKQSRKTAPKIEWDYVTKTIAEILEMINHKVMKIDPIGNRPSTVDDDGNAKNVGIIESLEKGIGISTLILRDTSNAPNLQKLYGKSVKFVVIDGGHRTRAITWFINGDRFAITVDGVEYLWSELDDVIRQKILDFPVPVSIVKCNNKQAKEIFIAHNKTTVVKPYSIIMSDEESKVCEYVRQMTKNYREYKTLCHDIFEVRDSGPVYFHGSVANKHNIWDTFVFVVIHKVMGKGNVVASEHTSNELVDSDTKGLSTAVKDEVKKFFDILLEIYDHKQKLITNDFFGCFQAVYFEMYERSNGKFNVTDMDTFAHKFHDAYTVLTSKKNPRTITVDDEVLKISSYIKTNSIAFSKVSEQKQVAELFFAEMFK